MCCMHGVNYTPSRALLWLQGSGATASLQPAELHLILSLARQPRHIFRKAFEPSLGTAFHVSGRQSCVSQRSWKLLSLARGPCHSSRKAVSGSEYTGMVSASRCMISGPSSMDAASTSNTRLAPPAGTRSSCGVMTFAEGLCVLLCSV